MYSFEEVEHTHQFPVIVKIFKDKTIARLYLQNHESVQAILNYFASKCINYQNYSNLPTTYLFEEHKHKRGFSTEYLIEMRLADYEALKNPIFEDLKESIYYLISDPAFSSSDYPYLPSKSLDSRELNKLEEVLVSCGLTTPEPAKDSDLYYDYTTAVENWFKEFSASHFPSYLNKSEILLSAFCMSPNILNPNYLLDVAEVLLSDGANPNISIDAQFQHLTKSNLDFPLLEYHKKQMTPLHVICYYWPRQKIPAEEILDAVKLLLKAKANVNAVDSAGYNALHFLCESWPELDTDYDKFLEIVYWLLKNGINVNAQTIQKKFSPLKWVCLKWAGKNISRENILHTLRTLIAAGASTHHIHYPNEPESGPEVFINLLGDPDEDNINLVLEIATEYLLQQIKAEQKNSVIFFWQWLIQDKLRFQQFELLAEIDNNYRYALLFFILHKKFDNSFFKNKKIQTLITTTFRRVIELLLLLHSKSIALAPNELEALEMLAIHEPQLLPSSLLLGLRSACSNDLANVIRASQSDQDLEVILTHNDYLKAQKYFIEAVTKQSCLLGYICLIKLNETYGISNILIECDYYKIILFYAFDPSNIISQACQTYAVQRLEVLKTQEIAAAKILGEYYVKLNQWDKAKENYEQAGKLAEAQNNKSEAIRIASILKKMSTTSLKATSESSGSFLSILQKLTLAPLLDNFANVIRQDKQATLIKGRYALLNKISIDEAKELSTQTAIHISFPPGQYRTKVLVGEGSFGKIRFSRDTTTQKFIAVKKIKEKEAIIKSEKEALFLTELKQCPYILPLIDSVETEGSNKQSVLYHFMPLAKFDGPKLLKPLACISEAKFKKQFLLHVAYSLLQAIKFAHEKNIYHLDIKPSNFLFDNKGNISLIDWRCAIKSEDFKLSGNFAADGRYCSPERLTVARYGYKQQQEKQQKNILIPLANEFLEEFDLRKADSWALGITLLELATGAYPFDSSAGTNKICGEWDTCYFEKQLEKIISTASLDTEVIAIINDLVRINFTKRLTPEEVLKKHFSLYTPLSITERKEAFIKLDEIKVNHFSNKLDLKMAKSNLSQKNIFTHPKPFYLEASGIIDDEEDNQDLQGGVYI